MSNGSDNSERIEHLEDLLYELGQNLLAAQDQNHYFVLLGEFRDKNFELEKKLKESVRIINEMHKLEEVPHLDCNFEFIEEVEALLKIK